MIQVYFSHLGEASLSGIQEPEQINPGTLREIFNQIEANHSGFCAEVLVPSGEQLNSATLVFKRIEVDSEGRLLEGEHTQPVRSLDGAITDEDENLLIALFHPERLIEFLLSTLTRTDNRFEYSGRSVGYRAFISGPDDSQGEQSLFAQAEPERLYPFTNGRSISELLTNSLIDVNQGRLIPVALRDAIASLWELEGDFRLRLFQEEALVYILGELAQVDASARNPLLLSIPTGGGKTEAFLIPLIAHLYNQRDRLLRANQIPEAKVRSLIIYPTRALANDQARRIAEILYQMNQGAVEDRKISVGVLTGDTPNSGYNLLTEKSLLQLCPNCSAVLTQFPERTIQGNTRINIARCICGAEIDYFRITRNDILSHPPDILITSPDMINRMLQSPKYHRQIFSPNIDLVVFDEIHMYESVFGCNVAHLLRRFEEACGHIPMYVGVSATIRNAKELACLIFNAALDAVRYLRPKAQDEPETEEKRPYLNYEAGPTRYRYHYAVAPARIEGQANRFQKVTTSVLNVADVIGHLIQDPHFRKTIIFSNFRQNTDDIVRFLRDQEDRYYATYQRDLLPRILGTLGATGSTQGLDLTRTQAEIVSAVDRWYRQAREIGSLHQPPLEIGWHRGGLEREERIKAVNRFASTQRLNAPDQDNSELPIDTMVATKTLELGIDIGDVTSVINCGAPFTTNEYTQRVGRGGRRKDSLALTVIDPRNPLDFYFLNHFDCYANPTPDDFEDAPIIVSNLEVVKSHIYGRMLDRLARYVGGTAEEILASELRDFRLFINGNYVAFRDNWQLFSQTLFEEIFTPDVVQKLQTWIGREADIIPDIHPTQVTVEQLREWWMGKFEQLHRRICTGEADIRETDLLSGMESKDRELVPDMRSSGPSVGMYLVREGSDDELRDTVSRRQAINSRPVGGYASQGSMTFMVEDVKVRDTRTEERIKELFVESAEGTQAVQYFSRMFGDENNSSPFPNNPIQVLIRANFVTPQDLRVKYNPYRFYCPHCGATYSDKPAGNDRCRYCYSELRQLTEVYVCGGCGDIYSPPVPKVCLNPSCIDHATNNGTSFRTEGYKRVGKGDRHNDYFRFTALPRLTWECRSCRTELNYHAFYSLSEVIKTQVADASWGTANAAQIAKSFLYKPESFWGKTYTLDGFHEARFNCKKCKNANTYRKIRVENIPSFRSVVHEYIIHGSEFAPEQTHVLGTSRFERVSIIALARESFRRFYSAPEQETKIDMKLIFPDNNNYLANVYDTHAVFFRFNEALEHFLEIDETALSNQVLANCGCGGFEPQGEDEVEGDDGADMTRPVRALLPWELGRKPDPRRKWCDVVQGLVPGAECPGQDVSCENCQYFDRKRNLRYLILHTLKHAIITAMPKYTGVNKNQLRGTIYPNDQKDYDLVLVDLIEGGSGCLYLLRQNWNQVWEVVGELLNTARNDNSQLLLPYTCSRYNRDLAPHLAYAFYEYVNSQQG
jgi:superfamily II DNA/RNA helicase